MDEAVVVDTLPLALSGFGALDCRSASATSPFGALRSASPLLRFCGPSRGDSAPTVEQQDQQSRIEIDSLKSVRRTLPASGVGRAWRQRHLVVDNVRFLAHTVW